MLILPLCILFKPTHAGSAVRRLGRAEGMRGEYFVVEGGLKGCIRPVTIGQGSGPATMMPRQPLLVIILTEQIIDVLTRVFPRPGIALSKMNWRLLHRTSCLITSQLANHPPDERHGL